MYVVFAEGETNEHPHNTKDSLKAAVCDIMSGINEEHLINACNHFGSQIEVVNNTDQ